MLEEKSDFLTWKKKIDYRCLDQKEYNLSYFRLNMFSFRVQILWKHNNMPISFIIYDSSDPWHYGSESSLNFTLFVIAWHNN